MDIFGDSSNAVGGPLRTWRCAAGHEFSMRCDSWQMLLVQDDKGNTTYHYCPHCFGLWAQEKWPLPEITDDSHSSGT